MEDDEPIIELFSSKEVFVYKVPPSQALGYRAAEWNLESPFITGSIKLVSKGELLRINIYNMQNALAASCPINFHEDASKPASTLEYWVEVTKDSSRYFGVRAVDPKSQKSIILGIGFRERDVAFGFQNALGDHFRRVKRQRDIKKGVIHNKHEEEEEEEEEKKATADGLSKDLSELSLKEPIKIAIKGINKATETATTTATTNSSKATTSSSNNAVKPLLAPPPVALESNDPKEEDVEWGEFN